MRKIIARKDIQSTALKVNLDPVTRRILNQQQTAIADARVRLDESNEDHQVDLSEEEEEDEDDDFRPRAPVDILTASNN